MNATHYLTLDRGPIAAMTPIGRVHRAGPWLQAALLMVALIVLVSVFPPRLADICDQAGGLVCGP